MVFQLQAAHSIALSCSKHICDQVAYEMLTSSIANKSDLNAAWRPNDCFLGSFALEMTY